jgi:hypothetical protein
LAAAALGEGGTEAGGFVESRSEEGSRERADSMDDGTNAPKANPRQVLCQLFDDGA